MTKRSFSFSQSECISVIMAVPCVLKRCGTEGITCSALTSSGWQPQMCAISKRMLSYVVSTRKTSRLLRLFLKRKVGCRVSNWLSSTNWSMSKSDSGSWSSRSSSQFSSFWSSSSPKCASCGIGCSQFGINWFMRSWSWSRGSHEYVCITLISSSSWSGGMKTVWPWMLMPL